MQSLNMPKIDEMLVQARQLAVAKDMAGSARLYREILKSGDNAEALLHLASMEADTGSYRLAHDYMLRALAMPSALNSPALAPSLLLGLRHFNESGAMRRYMDGADFLRKIPDAGILRMISTQLSWLGDQDAALAFVNLSIGLMPALTTLYLSRVQIQIYRGDFDAAEADLQDCLRREPEHPDVLWTLAHLRKWKADNNHVDVIRRVIAKPATTPYHRMRLYYALHKELDDLGDIAGAFAALDAAGKMQRQTLNYDKQRTRHLFSMLKQLPTGVASPAPQADFTPVFIVGMYRSGTTLLEQLMGGYEGMVNAGELRDMASCLCDATDHYCPGTIDAVTVERAANINYAKLGQQYLDGVRWRLHGRSHITDKWPPNHLNVGFICQAMPQAKIIDMSRDAVETCFSIMRVLFMGAAPYSYDQLELADYYNQYRDLMDYWAQRFPDRILKVNYAGLTHDTEATMRKVAQFCEFDFSDKLLQPNSHGKSVATASAVQVRDKVIARDVPKWAPYQQYLQPLINALH
jgi:tetratricopeptide (TPR) repeat protein